MHAGWTVAIILNLGMTGSSGTPSDFVCDLQIAVPSAGVAKAAVGNPSVVFPVPVNRLQAAVGTPRVRFPATSTPSVQIVGGG